MRILIAYRFFYPGAGGMERVIAESGRAFRRAGHDVTVLCAAINAAGAGQFDVDGLHVIRHEPVPYGPIKTLRRTGLTVRAARREFALLDGRVDLLIAKHAWYAAAAAGALGAPMIFAPEVMTSAMARQHRRHRAATLREKLAFACRTLATRRTERIALARADAVVQPTALTAAEWVEVYGELAAGIRIIPNGVDSERFRPGPPDAALWEELGLGPEDRVILLAARLTRPKDPLFAIEAFAKLTCPGAHLVIAGDGYLAGEVRRRCEELRIADRVVHAGMRADIVRFYRLADVLILPSRYEAFGNVQLEAMACGVPVIARRSGGEVRTAATEIVVHGETGLCTDPHDPADMAAAVDTLLADEALTARMRKAARRRAVECFSWSQHVERMLQAVGLTGAADAGAGVPAPIQLPQREERWARTSFRTSTSSTRGGTATTSSTSAPPA